MKPDVPAFTEILSLLRAEKERRLFAGSAQSQLGSVLEQASIVRDCLSQHGSRRMALISDSYHLVLPSILGAIQRGATLALIAPQTPPDVLIDQIGSFGPDSIAVDVVRGETDLLSGLSLEMTDWRAEWQDAVIFGTSKVTGSDRVLEDESYVVLFTSGTSGKPRMVAHTPGSLLAAYCVVRSLRYELYADQVDPSAPTREWFGSGAQLGAPMTYLSAMPAATISGLSLGLQALLGGEIIVDHPIYDPDEILRSIGCLSVTSIGLPPVVALAMARQQRKKAYDVETLMVLGMGGNPVSPELHELLERLFECRVMTGYGSTELGGAVTTTRFLDPVVPWSVGRAVPLVTTRQDSVTGELLAQSPAMSSGLMTEQGVIEALPLDRGWFRTGDVLRWHSDTEIFSFDHRLSEVITRGGRKIQPEDIERVLLENEGVGDAVVVGIPSRLLGEEDVVAVVVPKRPIQIAQLRRSCIDRLGPTWSPRSIRLWESIPRLPTGKPNRIEVRKSFAMRSTAPDLTNP